MKSNIEEKALVTKEEEGWIWNDVDTETPLLIDFAMTCYYSKYEFPLAHSCSSRIENYCDWSRIIMTL